MSLEGRIRELERSILELRAPAMTRTDFHAPIDMRGNQILNVADPRGDTDAVNKRTGSTTYAPVGAQYLVGTADASLTAKLVGQDGVGTQFSTGGSSFQVNVGDGTNFAWDVTNTCLVSGALTATNKSCGLEVGGTINALKLPSLTTTQRDALTGADGMVVFNSTTGRVEAYYGGGWNGL